MDLTSLRLLLRRVGSTEEGLCLVPLEVIRDKGAEAGGWPSGMESNDAILTMDCLWRFGAEGRDILRNGRCGGGTAWGSDGCTTGFAPSMEGKSTMAWPRLESALRRRERRRKSMSAWGLTVVARRHTLVSHVAYKKVIVQKAAAPCFEAASGSESTSQNGNPPSSAIGRCADCSAQNRQLGHLG